MLISLAALLPGDVDVWSSETLNIVGPIGTIIAMIGFIYWGLAREWLVTGPAHRREIARLEEAQRRELLARDTSAKTERDEHVVELAGVRTDYTGQLVRRDAESVRREAELQTTIRELRLDVSRMFAAWQITDDARERVTVSRSAAEGETLRTVLEALRHSPLGDRVNRPAELEPPPTVGTGNG